MADEIPLERPKKKIEVQSKTRSWFDLVVFCTVSSIISFQLGAMQTSKKATPLIKQSFSLQQNVDEIKTQKEEVVKENIQIKEKLAAVAEEAVKAQPSVIKSLKKYYLLIVHSDGSYELRTGGSPSWRYNNPGKLTYGILAKKEGAIGNDGPLAIFPDYDTGINALEVYLFQSDFGFQDLRADAVLKILGSPSDGYNQNDYVSTVLKNSGIKANKVLKTMNVDERGKFIEEIQAYENWAAGNVVKFKNADEFQKKGY